MNKLRFHRYKMDRLVSVRQLSSAHYFEDMQFYDTPVHSHSTWEFVYCDKGHVSVWDDTRLMELGPGEIAFHQTNTPHHIHVGKTPTTMFLLSFACTNECMKLFSHKHIAVNDEQREIIHRMLAELRGAFELNQDRLELGEFHPNPSAPVGAEQLVCGHLEWLLISLLRNGVDIAARTSFSAQQLDEAMEQRIMTELKKYVREHLSEPITIDALAHHVHYSRTYITVQFKAATGMSIMDYVEKKRMERARELLEKRDRTVTQIAEDVGYSSLQYFSRRFRKVMGCAPSRYVRDSAKAQKSSTQRKGKEPEK